MNTCKSCKYFEETNGGRSGICFRFPPYAQLVPAQGIGGPTVQGVSYRAEVRPTDWCGEYAPKESTLVLNG